MPTELQDNADRRTQLAADRTVFAAERTYAAWVRTGLAALASGVGAKKLLEGVIPEWGLRFGRTRRIGPLRHDSMASGFERTIFSGVADHSRSGGCLISGPPEGKPYPVHAGQWVCCPEVDGTIEETPDA
jgi:Domain of unknown function (DUF202)